MPRGGAPPRLDAHGRAAPVDMRVKVDEARGHDQTLGIAHLRLAAMRHITADRLYPALREHHVGRNDGQMSSLEQVLEMEIVTSD